MRLQRIINKWRRVCDELTWTEKPEDWLERAIVTTPTWWHRPQQIVRAVKSKRMLKTNINREFNNQKQENLMDSQADFSRISLRNSMTVQSISLTQTTRQ
ncbi:hypothetical protein KSP40_PGU000692 [Platanthera guangdongensis]|uniref:Uncharacterized protein n=1 Tax=Platanthera guangdongensis TaxID=2320717 RepID=A0ABR2M9C1_9ASPA